VTKERLPPHQRRVDRLPVLHIDPVPPFDGKRWDLIVEGTVETPLRLTYEEILSLPPSLSRSDFHCVTGWSRLDNRWEGVHPREIVSLARPTREARYVTVAAEGFYTTSLALGELLDEEVLLATHLDGEPLLPQHGGPLRLVVPKLYAYKSVKWVRRLTFMEKKEPGYWESRGYSDDADPWKEERYA
jgi:DMSO/TMAO reductase YedYZ molybdopterin-dependent catalytic subunit